MPTSPWNNKDHNFGPACIHQGPQTPALRLHRNGLLSVILEIRLWLVACSMLGPVPRPAHQRRGQRRFLLSGILENSSFTFEAQASGIDWRRVLNLGKCRVKL